jgi:acetolactate synthase-1/2/3 large subunit
LDITKDAQTGSLDFAYQTLSPNGAHPMDPDSIHEAASLINNAERPYILIGHGVLLSGAESEVLSLAEKADIPVGSTLLGLSAFPVDHPLYAGMLGMHGNYGANMLTNQADVILAVGMRFDDRVTGNLARYAKQAKIIHIEIDPVEINKNVRVEVALQGDAKQALRELLPHIKSNRHADWLSGFKRYDRIEFEKVTQHEVRPTEGLIRMAEVVAGLSEKTKGEAVIVTDVGQHQMTAARYYRFQRRNSHITSGGLGAMGFALPAAIGAKLGAMEREVIVIVGDGGFQMNIQELGVIAQEKLPVKIVLLNNGFLGMVRQWQEMFFDKRYSFTELLNPEFTKIGEAYGIRSRKVTDRSELPGALDEMLKENGPFLLEVVVAKEENVFPMIPSGAAVDEVRLS